MTYNGITSFLSSGASLSQTVNQDSVTASVTSSLNPSVYGQSVTFTATVSATSPGAGTPTGPITFYEGSTAIGTATLSAGKTTLKTSSLPTGSDAITVFYGGDTNFTVRTTLGRIDPVRRSGCDDDQVDILCKSIGVRSDCHFHGDRDGQLTGKRYAYGNGDVHATAQRPSAPARAAVARQPFRRRRSLLLLHTITAVYNSDSNFTGSTSSAAPHRKLTNRAPRLLWFRAHSIRRSPGRPSHLRRQSLRTSASGKRNTKWLRDVLHQFEERRHRQPDGRCGDLHNLVHFGRHRYDQGGLYWRHQFQDEHVGESESDRSEHGRPRSIWPSPHFRTTHHWTTR